MKTFSIKSKEIKRDWYITDAKGQTLGRFVSKLSKYLRGKHKVEYTPNMDNGDYIIVLNAKEIIISGRKYYDKIYYHHTGYVGGIKKCFFKDMIKHHPERVIESAVKGMLPKGPLGRDMLRKLKVYPGSKHNHSAQKPKFLNI